MNLEENTKPDTKKAPETWTKKTIGEEIFILIRQQINFLQEHYQEYYHLDVFDSLKWMSLHCLKTSTVQWESLLKKYSLPNISL